MRKFIKLTDENGYAIYANVDLIANISSFFGKSPNAKATVSFSDEGQFIWVTETPEEIMDLINGTTGDA